MSAGVASGVKRTSGGGKFYFAEANKERQIKTNIILNVYCKPIYSVL